VTEPQPELSRQATDLQAAWCVAVDTHDLDAVQSLFVPGGTFRTRGRLMDATERAEFFTGLWAGNADRSTHVCRDVVATATGDIIAVHAVLTATFILADGSIRLAWGHYDDVAVGTPDGLRLVAKNIVLDRVELHTEARHGTQPELDHVGVAVEDLGRMIHLLTEVLGGTLLSGGLEPRTGLRSAQVTFAGGGKVELLEPTKDGPVRDFMAARGPGVHHLTVLVDDVDETIGRLSAAGFRTTGRSEPTAMWHEVYVHPRDAAGCLIQLVRAGRGYGDPVPVTAAEILADEWTWTDQVPVRVSG
jgi:methylmalonyl-CoA/ethylmalonyl-CoA epimerase